MNTTGPLYTLKRIHANHRCAVDTMSSYPDVVDYWAKRLSKEKTKLLLLNIPIPKELT